MKASRLKPSGLMFLIILLTALESPTLVFDVSKRGLVFRLNQIWTLFDFSVIAGAAGERVKGSMRA